MTDLDIPSRRSRRLGSLFLVVLVALAAAGCMPAQERTFVTRTNALRASQGLAPLHENDALTRKAEDWAQHMAATGRLGHSNLSAGLGGLRWSALGENVAYTPPTGDSLLTLHDMFAGSSGHRANMLNGQFTHMGVGVARGADGTIWVTEVFARL